jgi:hypothetical protein
MSYFGGQKVLPLRHHEAASSSSGRSGDDAGGPGMPAFDQLLAKTKEKAPTGLLVTADQIGFATTLAIFADRARRLSLQRGIHEHADGVVGKGVHPHRIAVSFCQKRADRLLIRTSNGIPD